MRCCANRRAHSVGRSAEEFWTISDGRAGQAINPKATSAPPLEDEMPCRFTNAHHKGEPLEVVESFAFPRVPGRTPTSP